MPELMLIGTAHVIDLKSPLERYIREFNPSAVALELDRERWLALSSNRKRSGGPIFVRLLAHLQAQIPKDYHSYL